MSGKLTGRGVLVWLLGFFGVIIAANIYFITVSARTFRGEDEQKPYLQGVEYNHTLAQRARQKELGWQAAIGTKRLPDGATELLVTLRDRDHALRSGVALTGVLRHPADEYRDRDLHFTPVGEGRYAARIAGVTPGAWNLVLRSQGQWPFEADRRLWLR